MNKIQSIATKATALALSFGAVATSVLAEAYDYSDYYDLYNTTSTSTMSDADALAFLGGLGVFGVILPLCCGLIALIFVAFNIWMLVDVIKRTEAELPNRQTWLIVLIVGLILGFGGIAALVYYFGPRKKLAPLKK